MHTDAPAFCQMVVSNPDISNATARFGAWLIGAAESTGGFPLELTISQVRFGFTRNGVDVKGMGGRYSTVNASIDWLQENGYLSTNEGRSAGFGFHARNYTIQL